LLETDASDLRRDRQVLVVGGTVVGLTLTSLLHRQGYDPLLVRQSSGSLQSRATFLSQPACQVMDSLAIDTASSDHGVPVQRVSFEQTSAPAEPSSVSPVSSRSGDLDAVVVDTRWLTDALEATLPDRHRSTDRALATLSPRDDGLKVAFEDGITEWFDVLVDASHDGVARRLARTKMPNTATLVQYEAVADTETVDSAQVREVWCSNAVAQRLPVAGGEVTLARLTLPQSAVDSASPSDVFHALTDEGVPEIGIGPPPGDEWESTSVRQCVDCGGSDRTIWGADRVVSCGTAAYPTAPATGFSPWFGIESGLGFLSELTRENRSVSDVIDAYTRQRHQRLGTLRRTVHETKDDHVYPALEAAPTVLEQIAALRQLTLGSFLDSRLQAVQSEGASLFDQSL
jgi:2-polyprenyl-6-methoxyphenol hydroxylase-like FAD-dependent oxidoreductase